MITDVTSVLMKQFATNMQQRIGAARAWRVRRRRSAPATASGLAIGLRAVQLALMRVFRRFFLPYRARPEPRRSS